MSGLLDRILADKRRETAELRGRADALRSAPEAAPRGFAAAVRDGGVIAELKRRSPSVPSFRNGDDPERQADAYAAGGAAAISIVTDTPRFGMTLDDVAATRRRSSLPILVKDFVIDPLQILAARAAGADAVLLIARLGDAARLDELAACAAEAGLDALVECHDEADLARAEAVAAPLVGVNSRDLDTLELDPHVAGRLLAAAPAAAVKVAESGMKTRSDVLAARASGADAFLIGGALLQSPDPVLLLRQLRGEA